MTAEISLGGEVLKSGNNYPFANEVELRLGFQTADMGEKGSLQMTAPLKNKIVRAGEYVAIGYNLQGLSQAQLENTKQILENVKSKLELYQKNKDQTALAGITKHDITGAMMQAGVQGYFAINQAQDVIATKQHGNVLKSPFMAYGSFATYIHPNKRYGMIFGGSFKGMMMDIDQLMYTAVSKDNDSNELKGFIQSQGARQSANEHLVPEMLFDDPNTDEKEVEGVSAVKALQIASSQGQTIYTITKDNYNQVLPKLSLSSHVMSDIRNAISAGREVTAHEKNIRVNGWSGSGYIIIDPQTGSGAYLIDGGANGGWITGDSASLISTLALVYTDSKTFLREKPWFSKSLIEKYKFNQISKYTGLVGLLINFSYIASKDDLSTNQKYFQVFTNMLGYALIAYIGNAIMLATPLFLGIILSVTIAVTIAMSIILINNLVVV